MVRVPRKRRTCSRDAAGAPGAEAKRRLRGIANPNSILVAQQEQVKENEDCMQLHHNEYNNLQAERHCTKTHRQGDTLTPSQANQHTSEHPPKDRPLVQLCERHTSRTQHDFIKKSPPQEGMRTGSRLHRAAARAGSVQVCGKRPVFREGPETPSGRGPSKRRQRHIGVPHAPKHTWIDWPQFLPNQVPTITPCVPR
jgi:hypothetical protein